MEIEGNTEKKIIHSSKAEAGKVYESITGLYVMKCKDWCGGDGEHNDVFVGLQYGEIIDGYVADLIEVNCKLVVE